MLGLMLGLQVAVAIVGFLTSQWAVMALAGLGCVIAMRGMKKVEQKIEDDAGAAERLQTLVDQKVDDKTRSLRELVQRYEMAALTDPLTGLLNRRGGQDAIYRGLSRSRRVGTACSFLLIDIDHFKQVNDTFGHETGDMVLCSVGRTIVSSLRVADLAIRWGGEEILVYLPDTDLAGAIQVAEKLRQLVEGLEFEGPLKVTASTGVAEVMGKEEIHTTLARADMNLYVAKANGRNRVFPASLDQTPLARAQSSGSETAPQ